jgi:glutaredoxin
VTFRRTTCPHCRAKLEAGQRIHPACISDYADAQEAKSKRTAAKQARAAAKVERAEIKKRKEALKRIPDHIKEAQHAFNAFIRARDAQKPCICCGKPLALEAVGGGFDCGHYRSTGSASHLRFHEDNAHGQRKVCNRYGAGRAVDYRIGLVKRIGLERVDELECNNTPKKWTREELIEITQVYRKKLKEMLK